MMRAQNTAPGAHVAERMSVAFQPMGESRCWPVATAWIEGGFVRWSSPCLDERHEHGDRQAFASRFGDCACTFPAYMRAMEWLDALCFAATDLRSVAAACEANTEYGLHCTPEPIATPQPLPQLTA